MTDDILGNDSEAPIVRTGKRYAKDGKLTPTTKDKQSKGKASPHPKAKPKAKPATKARKGVKAPITVEASKGGRPTLYNATLHPQQAHRLALLGLGDNQMAAVMGISPGTFNNWKKEHEEFLNELDQGRDEADGHVAAALLQRAVGYSHPDVDIKMYKGDIIETPIIKHYPPDTAAALTWLKNRQPRLWRDRTVTEVVGLDDGPVQHAVGPLTDYAALRNVIKARKGDK